MNSQAENMSFSLAWPSRACGAPLFWSRAAASWLAVPEVFCELPQLPFSLLRTVCLPCTSSSWGSIGVERKKEKKERHEALSDTLVRSNSCMQGTKQSQQLYTLLQARHQTPSDVDGRHGPRMICAHRPYTTGTWRLMRVE